MKRLVALLVVAAAALLSVTAQSADRTHRVGILTPAANQWDADAFQQAMRTLGHVEGTGLVLDIRSADSELSRLPALAADLVRARPDVIVAINTPGSRAAIETGTDIPIVMAVVGDPVSLGFVDSLARPGGNVTGVSNVASDITAKRLALFKEAVPSLARVMALYHPDEPIAALQMQELEQPARTLGIEIAFAPVRTLGDLERAFDAASTSKVDGVFRLAGQATTFAPQTNDLALRHRKPLMALQGADVRGGALLSYFADHPELFRRVAVYVDRILKGARAGTLPIEQPTKFELVINLRTANALGLTVPQSVLLRADEVVE
jgi:putative ABC transport system substrate-binding protein